MSTLQTRLSQDDVKDLPDWQVANILNLPDPSLPIITEWEKTSIGIGTILDILGPTEGSIFLDTVSSAANSNSILKWGMKILENSNLDISLQSTRDSLTILKNNGMITDSQLDALFSVSRRQRYPSWSEYHGIEVTARTVGLARGGI